VLNDVCLFLLIDADSYHVGISDEKELRLWHDDYTTFHENLLISPRPDRLWTPSRLLSNLYRGLLPRKLSGWGVKLTIHPYLM